MSERKTALSIKSHGLLQLSEKIAIGIFLILLIVSMGEHMLANLSNSTFHEELRILYHLDPDRTNSKDYAGQFLSEFPQPLLYAFVTQAAVKAGIDLIMFHKSIVVFCGFLLLAGAAASGWRVGGILAAAVITVFIAAQPIYNYQISSATPHAFAFPLLMWALVSLIYDRLYLLAGLTVMSSFLYPPISPVLGLILAWHFVVARKGLGSHNHDRTVNLVVISIVAVISIVLLRYQLTPIEGYGATLSPGDKIDAHPENGPDGRHFYGVFNPLRHVYGSAIGQFHEATPIFAITLVPFCIVAIAGLGLYYLRNQPELFRALLSFIVPSSIFAILVTLLRPYVSYRFLLYPLFTVLPLLFIYGFVVLCYDHRSSLRYPAAIIAAVMVPLILAFSSTSGHREFALLQLDKPSSELIGYIRQLPEDSLIAAWPNDEQTSLIPYAAGRPLLVDYKAHYPTYEGHIIEMRMRMFDLIDAYLARDPKPLVDLRCRWQVDFMVVDRSHFSAGGDPPTYFAPFDDRIETLISATELSKMLLRRAPADAVVFEAGTYQVIDLELLSRGSNCPTRD